MEDEPIKTQVQEGEGNKLNHEKIIPEQHEPEEQEQQRERFTDEAEAEKEEAGKKNRNIETDKSSKQRGKKSAQR